MENYHWHQRKASEFDRGLVNALKVIGVIWLSMFSAILLIWIGVKMLSPTQSESISDETLVYVDLEEKLEELGATDISGVIIDDKTSTIDFTVGGVSANLICSQGQTELFFTSPKDLEPIRALPKGYSDTSKPYYDDKYNMCLTEKMIRCIDYAGMVGEFYQKQSGEYHAVYDDIGIWVNGDEPADYDYD